MKLNQHIIKRLDFSACGSLLAGQRSGFSFRKITRPALLTIAFGITVVLATSRASTTGGVSTRLITAVTINQDAKNPEETDLYQTPRSPTFSDFFGS